MLPPLAGLVIWAITEMAPAWAKTSVRVMSLPPCIGLAPVISRWTLLGASRTTLWPGMLIAGRVCVIEVALRSRR